MMNKVRRDEVLAVADYMKVRDEFRQSVMAQKADRRVHLGEHLTFLFENHDTVLYQIQEMMRAEGITGESGILHEIETYNELLGENGELGATLLIEIDDAAERDRLLRRWRNLPGTLYLETADGDRIPAVFDSRQVDADRLSSVQYVIFPVGDRVVGKLGTSHPDIDAEVGLTPRQVAALSGDLVGA
jgi:hypothetical protein